MKKLKYLIFFLGFNVFIAALITINYFKDSYQKQQIIQAHINYKHNIVDIEKKNLEKIIKQNITPIHLAKVKNPNDLQICQVLGPLTISQSTTLQSILNKASQLKTNIQYQTYHHPIYQIYWNLGTNYNTAQALFEKQKTNGTMNNPKFVLSQDGSNWIVNIAQLDLPLDNVISIATNLAEKADKVNAGGHWQYRTLPDAYFYKFSSFNSIPTPVINSINLMVNPAKESCSN
jgi:hypothetical protein